MHHYEVEAVYGPDPDGGPKPVLKLAVPDPLLRPGTVRYFTRVPHATGVKVTFDHGSPFRDKNGDPIDTVESKDGVLPLKVPGDFFAHCALEGLVGVPPEEYGGNHVVR
jgi:hypothetical protein